MKNSFKISEAVKRAEEYKRDIAINGKNQAKRTLPLLDQNIILRDEV